MAPLTFGEHRRVNALEDEGAVVVRVQIDGYLELTFERPAYEQDFFSVDDFSISHR
jgi:hypothetical protein